MGSPLSDPGFLREFEKQKMISQIAQKTYHLRIRAGLTQKTMAEKSQTTQQIIVRIKKIYRTRLNLILDTRYVCLIFLWQIYNT